jgi:hypothetical protein
MISKRIAASAAAVGTLVVLAACADQPTALSGSPAGLARNDVSVAAVAEGELRICKVTVGGDDTFTFNWSITNGASGTVALSNGQCATVQTGLTDPETATVTEEAPPANWSLTQISVVDELNSPIGSIDLPARSAQARVSNDQGAEFTFTNTFTPPDPGCTFTQGYWKNHPEVWVGQSVTLGSTNYTQAQLLSIFGRPVKGNGLVSLSHQLIAAKLNIAAGADPTDAAAAIAAADALIGGLVVPPIGSGYLAPSSTASLTTALDNYNNGVTGPGHCN